MNFSNRLFVICLLFLGAAGSVLAQTENAVDRTLELLRKAQTNQAPVVSNTPAPSALSAEMEAKAREMLRATRIFELRPTRDTEPTITKSTTGTTVAIPTPAVPAAAPQPKQSNDRGIADLVAKERERKAREDADRQKEIERIEAEVLKAAAERKSKA